MSRDPPARLAEPRLEGGGSSQHPPRVEKWPIPAAHVVLWGAVAGWLLGQAVLFADYWTWDPSYRDRANDGTFILWAIAISAQTMAWVLALPLIRSIKRRWAPHGEAATHEVRWATAALILFAVAIAVVPALTGPDLPDTVPHRSFKLGLLNLGAFTIAIYAARAIWHAADQLRDLGMASVANLAALERHRAVRSDLERLLGVLGALVSLGVIASAALHALTVDVDPENALPVQAVIAYGIVLSVILALTYIPAHLTMLEAGTRIRDRIAPLFEVGDPGFLDRLDERDRIAHYLGLDVPVSVRFRGAVVILGPLLGSLTSLIPELSG